MENKEPRQIEKVLSAIIARGDKPFKVSDIAEALGIGIFTTRGYVNYLLKSGHVIYHGWETSYRKCGSRNMRDAIQTYQWTGKTDQIKRQRTEKWKARQFVECR